MVKFTSFAILAVAMLSPLGLALPEINRDPKTTCTTFTDLVTTTETRHPQETLTSVILYEYPVTSVVYATSTNYVVYTTERTRTRTRTYTETVSQCTVY